ncbi:hypothetical protein [Streptomyces sp. WZ-12]|uniref:hypothetical protein n=1 Tax=Streptomyces sp. WZ-12 TaxID=3030210 RepID=UPI0023811CB4|nr:hypothetical protein [Streptomyces sp. WZ-12]
MTDSRAGTRRRRVTTAGAAALVVVVGGAVTSCGAEQPSPRAELSFGDTLHTQYLRWHSEAERTERGPQDELFAIDLGASRASPGRSPLSAENIRVTVDLSAVKTATYHTMSPEHGCKASGHLVTCTPKNIETGDHRSLVLFKMTARASAAKGAAEPLNITVTSTNAPTIHHTTQLVHGAPSLTVPMGEDRTELKPGSELQLRPAFGNAGQLALDDDLNVVVDVNGQATLPKRYRNCRYDKAASPTKAVCRFSGPLPAGAAYETAAPLTAVIDDTGRQGMLSYTVYRAHDTPATALLPDSAPRGTGAPLGLRPVDGGDFSGYSAERATGYLGFHTTRTHDAQVNGFTLKGKVGKKTSIDLMGVDGYYEGDTVLTLPEGVSVEGSHEGDVSEDLYCSYLDRKNRKVICPGPLTTEPTLRFRIDERVDGARGTITVKPDPGRQDPDLTNNSAPITMEYLD